MVYETSNFIDVPTVQRKHFPGKADRSLVITARPCFASILRPRAVFSTSVVIRIKLVVTNVAFCLQCPIQVC